MSSRSSAGDRGAAPLHVNVPDTIVYFRTGPPCWFFTSNSGALDSALSFSDDDIIRSLCDTRYPRRVVAVLKRCWSERATSGEGRTDDGESFGTGIVLLDSSSLLDYLEVRAFRAL